MFVSSKEMILAAQRGGYAVPAFNAENLEMLQGIIAAAEQMRSPVIIQTTPPTVKYLDPFVMHAMVSELAKKASVPIALHLDHCTSFDDCMLAIRAGYSSVMFDGSKLDFDENARLTEKVVDCARPMGVTVEAELGTVGGKEDNVASEVKYTEVGDAVEFVKRTGVDLLAIAIGTAHGFYKGKPKLDFERIGEIRAAIDTPLVLHGGSGIPEEDVKRTISLGMCKVNFATELRAAATKGVRSVLGDESVIDPKKYMSVARREVTEMCIAKILMCGSENKAL